MKISQKVLGRLLIHTVYRVSSCCLSVYLDIAGLCLSRGNTFWGSRNVKLVGTLILYT